MESPDSEDPKIQLLFYRCISLSPRTIWIVKIVFFIFVANFKQKKAAKIATISLIINIFCSIILMQIMGVVGLALAGSIGGFILFLLTYKEYKMIS